MFSCSKSTNEPVKPNGITRNKKSVDTPNGVKPEEQDLKIKPKPNQESEYDKKKALLIKSIETFSGKRLQEKQVFIYNKETLLLDSVLFEKSKEILSFNYVWLNDKLSKVELKTQIVDETNLLKLKFINERVSSMTERKESLNLLDFSYEDNKLKSLLLKRPKHNVEKLTYQWDEFGNMKIEEEEDLSYHNAYTDKENKVYPDLNFILNTAKEEDYFSDWMMKRSTNYISQQSILYSFGLRKEYRYSYSFDKYNRPVEVRMDIFQDNKDLGSYLFKITYLIAN